jgi:hypothetical protein
MLQPSALYPEEVRRNDGYIVETRCGDMMQIDDDDIRFTSQLFL